jgi:phosphatidylserine/phosphatidylglycerophosphate/cardiolipin synthase-like enzyme
MIKKTLLLSYLFLCLPTFAADYPKAFFDKECETAIKKEISQSKKHIRLAVYSFTRFSLAGALSRAVDKGVDVQVILDSKQLDNDNTAKIIQILLNGGVKVFTIEKKDKSSMHHKFMTIDGKTLITGSFNYTTSASRYNSENIVIIKNEITGKFDKEWLKLKNISNKELKKTQK